MDMEFGNLDFEKKTKELLGENKLNPEQKLKQMLNISE